MTAVVQSMDGGSNNKAVAIVPVLSLLLDEDSVDPTLPIADAGLDIEVLVGDLVQLDGAASSDPEARPLTFLWSFDFKPAASTATINIETSAAPGFVLDVPGVYMVQLIVNNGIQDSEPDTVMAINTNRMPIADAGENSIELLSQVVELDGSGSSDIDTDPLTYLWSINSLPPGSVASLSDNTLQNPEFTPDVKGNYIFDLLVNDGFIDSEVDQVEVLAGAELELAVADVFFGINRETTGTVSIDPPAPPQGVVISLAVDDTIIDLAESQLNFAAGETEKTFTLSALATGVTDLTASTTNVESAVVSIEVTAVLISVDDIEPLSPSASRSVAISLSDAAPMGGATINLESLNPGIATVSPASLFIAEGQFTPAQNAQVTGVSVGSTSLRATAAGFAPDEKAIEVALAAAFDPGSLNVPETLSRNITLTLDAPAPTGGVTFDLAVIGDDLFGVQSTVTIDEGQTQSQPISLTGLAEGLAILRASATGFVDADAAITVIDAPNVFLGRNGSNSHLEEAEIGVGLQNSYRLRLEVTPTSAVDIRASVPENSGVLLSSSTNMVGGSVLLIEDVISSITSPIAIQGLSLGDDVPLTLEVFEANTTTPAGYEALLSTIDIDPSGVYVSSSDYSTTKFATNRVASAQVGLLYDDENAVLEGQLRQVQQVRAGAALQVAMQVDDNNVLTLPDGASGTLTINPNSSSGSIAVSPLSSGVATVSIASQPSNDFSLPTNRDDNVQITITTPEAFLRTTSSNSHLVEAVVGQDLQKGVRIGLQSAPPNPVDIQISVPDNSGVSLSSDRLVAGSTQIVLEDISNSISPFFYIQGLALGDDVPISINIFDANTTTPTGFDILASTVDIDPSGIYVNTADYTTTTFSSDRSVSVQPALLYDAETPALIGQRLAVQGVRGGSTLTVPMQVNNATIASLPAGANDDLFIQAAAFSGSIPVTPIGAGDAIVSIASLPADFVVPVGNDDNAVVTVNAPNAFLRSTGSASHQAEATVGIDLQSPQFIGLAATPPAPVDINISVPAGSGVLLSKDGTTEGTSGIQFEDVTTSRSPMFFIQGSALGDDVNVTIEVLEANTVNPIGYNVLASTVDVDPSGVYMATSDFQTNTFAANRSISVTASLLFDDEDTALRDGQRRQNQAARGGVNLNVSLAIDNDTVVVLPAGASDTLVIAGGQTSGTIEVDPQTAGVATVSISSQPNANFTLPSNLDGDVVITVTAPNARFNLNTAIVGDELQLPVTVILAEVPPNPVDVTVEVTAAAVALISKDGAIAGGASVTFENVASASVGTIFVQGLSLNAATQIKVSAPGYNDGTADVEVVLSGFRLSGTFSNINVGNTRDFTISSARLNPNGTFAGGQQVRGGASFDINVSSSQLGVGTVTSPVTINGGSSTGTTTFSAFSAGTSNIQVTQPAGFTPPVGLADGDITVE